MEDRMEREEFLLLIIDLPVFMNVDNLPINGVGFGQFF